MNTLRFRKVYGGMKGDMQMIEYYTQNMKMININKDKIFIIKHSIDGLDKGEWLIEANDFHCNKHIIKYIKDKFPKYNEDYIKDLIWIFSSSINYRIDHLPHTKKQQNDWEKIQKTVRSYQRRCIYY